MALIIYPLSGFDSFVTLEDTTSNLTNNVIDITAWTALTETVKEIYLRQATLLIKSRIDLDLVVSVDNLELATSLLANYAVGVDITDDTNDGNIKINEITGVIHKEYFTKGKASNAMPTNVVSLLSEYGFVGSGSIKILRA
jgi:hypothetical protein